MPIAALVDEIANDPLGRGYAGMSDTQVSASLNAADRPSSKRVSNAKYLQWIAGARRKVIGDAADSHADATVRGLAQVALDLLLRADIEYDRGDHLPLLQALQAGGVLTAGDVTALDAQADTIVSRADELGIGRVRDRDVREAR